MNQSPLLVKPTVDTAVSGEYIRVTLETANWETLHFAARRMKKGEQWREETADNEYATVILGGVCSIRSSWGEWLEIGRRPDVFSGMPYTLYLPRHTQFTVEATSATWILPIAGALSAPIGRLWSPRSRHLVGVRRHLR